jgi:hypothetical protein
MDTANTPNVDDDTVSGDGCETTDQLAGNVIRCDASCRKNSRTAAPTANRAEELVVA